MEERKFNRIGGTAVSAIVGQNPWDSPHGVYLKLRREVSSKPDNAILERGRRLEPVVASVFQANHPDYRVAINRDGSETPDTYVHPDHAYLMGHPDRLLYNSDALVAGLEIKTTSLSNWNEWGEEGTDKIPSHYLIQSQWYAGLANLPEWLVAVAFVDDSDRIKTVKEYRVTADAELFEVLVDRAVEFWENHVLPGVPPELTAVDESTTRWIQERFPRNVNPLAVATSDEEDLMTRYIAAKQLADDAQKGLEYVTAQLKLAIGDRDGLTSETYGRVTWKRSKNSTRVDYRAIVEELNPPNELIAKHSKTVEGSRRFVAAGLRG